MFLHVNKLSRFLTPQFVMDYVDSHCFDSVWPVGGAPNYYPNSFSAPDCQPQFVETKFRVSQDVTRYNSNDDDNVTQVFFYLHYFFLDRETGREGESAVQLNNQICSSLEEHYKYLFLVLISTVFM